jgi:hypothetical protein
MADKYLKQVSGVFTEQEAKASSGGAGDAGKIIALDPTGRIDGSMMPVGIGAETKTLQASENLADGDFVNIFNDTGTVKARKADATTPGKEANGFVLAAVVLGGSAVVYLDGINTHLVGLTAGSVYYLSTTAGTVTDTSPSGTGNVVQRIGRALSATEIDFDPGPAITLA